VQFGGAGGSNPNLFYLFCTDAGMLAKNLLESIDRSMAADGGMKFFAEKFGRTPTRPGLKERFPKLRIDRYLVVKPEIVGPNFREFTKLYNEIFGIGK
jgi:hypothetical protein